MLTEARAISPSGDIVADSNAGLVLLRRNGGTDAPVLGPIQVSSNRPYVPVQLTLSFRDRNPGDTHTATIDWGDGRGPQPATVRESRGRGEVHGEVVFPSEGGFAVVVRVTDSAARSTVVRQQIDVFVSGPNIATAAKQSPANVADGTRTKATTYGWKGGEPLGGARTRPAAEAEIRASAGVGTGLLERKSARPASSASGSAAWSYS